MTPYVGVFVRLKVRLLVNQLRGKPWRAVLAILAALFFAGQGIGGAVGTVGLRLVGADAAGGVVVILGALLILSWALVPLLLLADDDTLDPARFALLPLRRNQLAVGLLAASCVGVAPLATFAVALATIVTWTRGPGPVAYAIPAALLGGLTCVVASRATTTAAAASLSGRRGRESVTVVLVVAATCFGFAGPAIGWLGRVLGQGGVRLAVEAVAWSPLGAAWGSPYAAAQGREWVALARLGVAAATLSLLWAVYERSLERRVRPRGHSRYMSQTPAVAAEAPAGLRLGVIDRAIPDSPLGALLTRCLLYWRRDPRYAVSFGLLPLMVIMLTAFSLGIDGFGGAALAIAPLIALMLSLTMVNELAFDGTALWTTLAAGVPGRVERMARHVAVLSWGAPLTIVSALAGCAVTRRWDLAPALLGSTVGLLLVGLAVTAVVSTVWTYPVPEAGANPFATSSGGSMAALLQQAAAGTGILVLALPIVALVAASLWLPPIGWVVLVVAPAYGIAALNVGVTVGGRRFDRHGPQLLSSLRS